MTAAPARVVDDAVESAALRGNALGDPERRRLYVWLPPGYDDNGGTPLPAIYVLPGYGSPVERWAERDLFSPTIFERLDRLYAGEDPPPPCVHVFVDGSTRYGGSQFVNSPATGRYQDYVAADVDGRYRTAADPAHRGVAGHSSGGVGALALAMRRPDVFGACASHAGDALFEHCYGRELGGLARALRDHDGDLAALVERLLGDELYRRGHFGPLMMVACAAAYSPDAAAPLGIGLPVDARGRVVPEHWERWLAQDPLRMLRHRVAALRGLRALFLDAGDSDEYFMDLGAAALHEELTALGVEHRYERFAGPHSGNQHRYPIGFAHLARALATGDARAGTRRG